MSRVVFSPLCFESGAVHGGEEASQIGAGRYSQVKHQEHEARRLVGIDESDWGKRQKGRETEMERSGCILKGLSTLRQQWAVTGKENQRRQQGPKGWPHFEVEQSQEEGSRGAEAVLGGMGSGQDQQDVAVI